MSNKLKSNNIKDKIKEPENATLDYPVLCFKYLTTNNGYNVKYFNHFREKAKAYSALFYLISDIQSTSWKDLMLRGKTKGFESINSGELNFKPSNYKITPDEKVFILRFKRNNYRLIGVKSNKNKDVLHVIGFDFDYTAYNHGS